MKMKCFYHTDMDGKCAGAIVYKFYKRDRDYTVSMGEECQFIPINYNNDFPFDSIAPGEAIVIVDFSLQKEGEFQRLLEITEHVIWIDHHKTAIEKHGDIQMEGIRRDGVSGCELTWEYFYPRASVPRVVTLLGDYDIWAFKYGDDTKNLQSGIRLHDTRPESPEWMRWLDSLYNPIEMITEGVIATKYRDNYYAGLIKAWSFPVEFEGLRGIACNAGSVSSQLFDTAGDDYDIMIPFVYDGTNWTVSLYTKRDDLDVSEIAKKYGGGGHRKASGFQCGKLPFWKQ
jgi:oligoribonuclease NrnB/cAMP/cGMP phosphodiesterase (DHH superfamily)